MEEEGMTTHARNNDQFMELLWETGQVSKKARYGYDSPILTKPYLNRSALFPDELNFNSNDKHFRDSQIVPVVHPDNEFRFVEDATPVPIFMESEHIKKKPTLVRNRQALETRNDHEIRPALVNNNLVQSRKLIEGFEGVRNRLNAHEEIGIVPTIGNKTTPRVKAMEARSSSECSRGASNDVSYASKRGYDGADEGSINTNEQSLGDDETSDSIVPSWGKTRTKRYRINPEDRNLSESRKFNKKLRALQKLVPNCNTVDKASLLDEAIYYLRTLQIQVRMMSMGSGLCMSPPLMMLPSMGALIGCNSSPFLNFPILGTTVPGVGGMTNSQLIPMLPNSFSQQPIIPNFLPYFNSMPPGGVSGYQFNNP